MVGVQKVSLSIDSCGSQRVLAEPKSRGFLSIQGWGWASSKCEEISTRSLQRFRSQCGSVLAHLSIAKWFWSVKACKGQRQIWDQWQGAGLLFYPLLHKLVFALKDAEVQVQRGHVFCYRLKLDFPQPQPFWLWGSQAWAYLAAAGVVRSVHQILSEKSPLWRWRILCLLRFPCQFNLLSAPQSIWRGAIWRDESFRNDGAGWAREGVLWLSILRTPLQCYLFFKMADKQVRLLFS